MQTLLWREFDLFFFPLPFSTVLATIHWQRLRALFFPFLSSNGFFRDGVFFVRVEWRDGGFVGNVPKTKVSQHQRNDKNNISLWWTLFYFKKFNAAAQRRVHSQENHYYFQTPNQIMEINCSITACFFSAYFHTNFNNSHSICQIRHL